ncbi:MAG: hypothetical protein HY681_01680 [Chloroflexi bacterium]|nr:hypothetical protein [Chloroflexota bacterium]
MKIKRVHIGILLGIIALAVVPLVASASHSWNGYHWARTSNPFTLKLGDNVSSTWDPYLAAASSDWSTPPVSVTATDVLDTTVVSGKAKGACAVVTSGRVEVCNKAYGNNGWLGVAGVFVSDSHITAGYVKLNDTYFKTAKYNTPAWRQFVTCQEIGHTLGLDHQDEAFDNPNLGTCMDYTNDPSRNDGLGDNLHPNAHDYEELGLIYSHLDPSTTLSAGVPSAAAAAAASDKPADNDFGVPTGRKDPKGRDILFVKDLGGGARQFTWVIWAD